MEANAPFLHRQVTNNGQNKKKEQKTSMYIFGLVIQIFFGVFLFCANVYAAFNYLSIDEKQQQEFHSLELKDNTIVVPLNNSKSFIQDVSPSFIVFIHLVTAEFYRYNATSIKLESTNKKPQSGTCYLNASSLTGTSISWRRSYRNPNFCKEGLSTHSNGMVLVFNHFQMKTRNTAKQKQIRHSLSWANKTLTKLKTMYSIKGKKFDTACYLLGLKLEEGQSIKFDVSDKNVVYTMRQTNVMGMYFLGP